MSGAILVIEDDVKLREQLTQNLEQAGYRVSGAVDVSRAEAVMRDIRPDLIVLDWVLPGVPGLTFARRLRANPRTREVPMVLLCARAGEEDKVAALEGGADDYLAKPFSMRELLARIKAVLRRRAPQLADDIVEAFGLRLDPGARTLMAGDKRIELWATEFRLLHFFMTHAGRIFARAKLLDEVWGDHVFVEERTVDVHIRRLRQALVPTGHDALIETVRGIGYRFRPEPQTQEPAVAEAAYPAVKDLARLRAGSDPLARGTASLPGQQ